MKDTLTKAVITGTLLISGAVAPVVPSDMELQYSFETPDPTAFRTIDEVASTTVPLNLVYDDADKDGTVYFSVFSDKKGNDVYTEITKEKYASMGVMGGYSNNPKKNEYLSLFESLTPKAEATVTYDTATSPTSGGTDGAYSSVTFAHTTNTALQRVMVVGIADFGPDSASASSSITYNSVSLTHYVSKIQGGYDRTFIYYLADPATGANNVVITFNTNVSQYSAGAMTVYNAQTPLTNATVGAGTGTGDPSITVTSATGDMVFDVIGDQQKSATLGVGAGQTQRWLNSGASRRDGGASTEPGASSVTMSWTSNSGAGENWVQVGANIPQYATPTPPVASDINLIMFDW